ncbi:MAG: hypothetical protein FWG45_01110 [Oscillospiraceae bacterium]|nr:hypothetical protein [Oscillospiraceae bacterium]
MSGRKAQIAWIAVCAIMMLLTIFMVSLGLMFSGGRNATSMFGSNLYFVRGAGFDLVPAPNVIFGQEPVAAELAQGHLVMFVVDGKTDVGEILQVGVAPPDSVDTAETTDVTEDTDEFGLQSGEDVLYFVIARENGGEVIVAEGDITAKAVRTSRLLGYIFNFAASPLGVLFIAVIPCVCIILSEVLKPLFNRAKVAPVNKQDETPTFISVDSKVTPDAPAASQASDGDGFEKPPSVPIKPPKPPKSGKPIKAKVMPASPELFVPMIDDLPSPPKPAPTNTVNYAALKAYKDTLKQTQSVESPTLEQPQLFAAVEDVAAKSEPVTKPTAKKKPLSSVKLAEVIAAANAERERSAKELEGLKELQESKESQEPKGEIE